ncbi:MAG: hypothetical protein EBU85_05160 [Actinobacteria bacterium]|nr:hypothetical protein [Actinomycetota bacterium]
MAFPWFHEEESKQVGELLDYHHAKPKARYLVQFSDGEAYVCVFDTAFESDNSGELEIEMDNPLYDEFFQVVLRITEILKPGPRQYNGFLSLDYRDFPTLINDADTGGTVYPAEANAADAGGVQGETSPGVN